jgi:uncharacterized membrane protein
MARLRCACRDRPHDPICAGVDEKATEPPLPHYTGPPVVNLAGRVLSSCGWAVLALLATFTSITAMRYGLPTVPYPVLTNFVTHRPILSVHAISAAIALLVGPWQFLDRLRARRLGLHRVVGRIYVAAIALGWASSIPIALHAETGAIASAGFLMLGACWIATTITAVSKALLGNIRSHRRWMIRSYALTAAAITLRLYLGIAIGLHLPFNVAYPAIAWLCWIPNLAATELVLLLIRSRASGRSTGGHAYSSIAPGQVHSVNAPGRPSQ